MAERPYQLRYGWPSWRIGFRGWTSSYASADARDSAARKLAWRSEFARVEVRDSKTDSWRPWKGQ